MADNSFFPAIALIGGGQGALDGIPTASLADNDGAIIINDEGVFRYRLDASSGAAENSPLIIKPDDEAGNKRWILEGIYNEVYPEWWGAKGDGITDDSVAIQASIDSVQKSGGGIVSFAEGTYNFGTTLTIGNLVGYYGGTNLAGMGKRTTVLNYTGAGYAISLLRRPTGELEDCYFSDFKLIDGGTGTRGINFGTYCHDHNLTNLWVYGFDNGVYIDGTNSYGIIIEKCHIDTNVWGLYSTGGQASIVRSCDFEENTTGALYTTCQMQISDTRFERHTGVARVIHINADITQKTFGASIRHCWFEGNEGIEIDIDYNYSTNIIGNNFASTGITTVISGDNSLYTRIEGNEMYYGTNGIALTNDNYTWVGNNRINSTNPISLHGAYVYLEPYITKLKKYHDISLCLSETESWTDADATPSCYGSNAFRTANTTGATDITDFHDVTDGQFIYLYFGDNNTTLKHGTGNIRLQYKTDFTGATGDKLLFYVHSTTVMEVGQSLYRDIVAASTGAGTVKMGSANAANSAGWLEIRPGKFIPYWSDATP